jgi:hypothetical protein
VKISRHSVEAWMSHAGIKNLQCSCGCTPQWIVQEDLVEAHPFAGRNKVSSNKVVGSPVYVYVALTCKNCGNTQFYNQSLLRGWYRESEQADGDDSAG